MWKEELKNGNIRYLERYKDYLGNQRRVSVTFPKATRQTEKLARQILNEKILALSKDSGLTLGTLADLYLTTAEKALKESSYAQRKSEINALLALIGAGRSVSELNSGVVNALLLKEGLSNSSINIRIKTLKILLHWAYDQDLVEDIAWIQKLKTRKTESKGRLEEKYLESFELVQIINKLERKDWKLLAELTALSGMRVGEALALTNSDIDYANRIIKVNKTYTERIKAVTTPKTASSDREIYMQDELLDCCHRISQHYRAQMMRMGYRTDLFMCDKTGSYLNFRVYNTELRKAAEVLDRDIKLTSHVMRHTHVALLAEAGVPLEVISRRLGHEGSETTRKVYMHVTEKTKERERERLKEIRMLS